VKEKGHEVSSSFMTRLSRLLFLLNPYVALCVKDGSRTGTGGHSWAWCGYKERPMPRGLLLGTLGTLLFAGPFLDVSWAQDKAPPLPPFLDRSDITLQLSYSCPTNTACSFACPSGIGGGEAAGAGAAAAGPGAGGGLGAVGNFFGADHVTKLSIYLGTMPLGKRDVPVLFYVFSTRERPNSSGFSINAGLSATSCQVNGLTLDYSGRPPPTGRGLSPQMSK